MIVRITSLPPGDAPVEIGEKWVGVVLHGEPFGGWPKDVVSRKELDFQTGILVDTLEAIGYLENHNKEASNWWRGLYASSTRLPGGLVFPQECYELIEE